MLGQPEVFNYLSLLNNQESIVEENIELTKETFTIYPLHMKLNDSLYMLLAAVI